MEHIAQSLISRQYENWKGNYITRRQPLNRNQKNIEGDHAFAIDCMNTNGLRQGDKIRRFTPLECERLMGLPDNWTLWGVPPGEWHYPKDSATIVSDTQRYKLCGNGVVVNVVREIIKNII